MGDAADAATDMQPWYGMNGFYSAISLDNDALFSVAHVGSTRDGRQQVVLKQSRYQMLFFVRGHKRYIRHKRPHRVLFLRVFLFFSAKGSGVPGWLSVKE